MIRKLALWICPALKAELSALRSGNTRVVLENSKLLDTIDALRHTN